MVVVPGVEVPSGSACVVAERTPLLSIMGPTGMHALVDDSKV